MKKTPIMVICLVFAFTSFQIEAAVTCTPTKNTCTGPAKELVSAFYVVKDTSGDGPVPKLVITSPFVVPPTSTPDPSEPAEFNCVGTAGGQNIVMLGDDPSLDANYASLLAASFNDGQIAIRVDTTTSACTLSNIRVLN